MVALGLMLLLPRMQERLATAAGPIGNWIQEQAGGFSTGGLSGQFLVGLLLGAVWSPSVGPTLGAASLLAARSKHLTSVAITMAAFGIGAALPLLAIGLISREALARWRGRRARRQSPDGWPAVRFRHVDTVGLDKRIEALLVEASPMWLTDLTTRF